MKDVQYMMEIEKHLTYILKGEEDAITLCLDLWYCAQVWDDLYDGDQFVNRDHLNTAFKKLLIDIPINPFYARNSVSLVPLFMSVIMRWHTANVYEDAKGPGSLNKAYMLRAAIYDIFSMCAYLVGGYEWGMAMAPTVWSLYGENLDDYKKEIDNA